VPDSAWALVELAFELLAVTVDLSNLVVGKFAPLFLHLATNLLSVTLHTIPVAAALRLFRVTPDWNWETTYTFCRYLVRMHTIRDWIVRRAIFRNRPSAGGLDRSEKALQRYSLGNRVGHDCRTCRV
jgi:hypothetical protein